MLIFYANFLRQTKTDFANREVTGLNGDKPKASLVQLLGCSINGFGKNIGLIVNYLMTQNDKTSTQ